MTETQQFIEDAIKGGYVYRESYDYHFALDPLAWQARERIVGSIPDGKQRTIELASKHDMLEFMGYIADGKTIEEALKAIR